MIKSDIIYDPPDIKLIYYKIPHLLYVQASDFWLAQNWYQNNFFQPKQNHIKYQSLTWAKHYWITLNAVSPKIKNIRVKTIEIDMYY